MRNFQIFFKGGKFQIFRIAILNKRMYVFDFAFAVKIGLERIYYFVKIAAQSDLRVLLQAEHLLEQSQILVMRNLRVLQKRNVPLVIYLA